MPASSSRTTHTTIWITADACTPTNTGLAGTDPRSTVVLMIESIAHARTLAHHKRKLVFAFSVMRHFAGELRAAGWTVDYHAEQDDVGAALRLHARRYATQVLQLTQQPDWGATESLAAPAREAGFRVEIRPHANVVSVDADFDALAKSPTARVTLDIFYRHMRRKTGLLMDGAEPAGGRWNYDAENREPPKAGLSFAPPPHFAPDTITRDVCAFVDRAFPDHPGTTADFALAVTRADARSALERFCTERLDTFGPWQDAMLTGEGTMSHSLLAAYINIGLLHPLEVCERAERAYRDGTARLSSVEGFIRQIIGWREYVWRVYWRMMPDYRERNALGADLPLPALYWTGVTKMFCLQEAVSGVRATAYAHHIVRLMILGNFALIAGCDPIETNDWFWAMFIDAYDWVMVPNVIGMALHADGGYVGTKPYCASANYINKMSDYCKRCSYAHRELTSADACPFNALYWDFLARNETRFARNPRMAVIVRNWQRRDETWKESVRAKAARIRAALRSGDIV